MLAARSLCRAAPALTARPHFISMSSMPLRRLPSTAAARTAGPAASSLVWRHPVRLLATKSSDEDKKTAPEVAKKPGIMSMFREYGIPFIIWETVVWMGSGVVVYGGVTLYGGYDAVLPFLKSINFDQYVDLEHLDPRYGNLAIAVAINEALEVFRFPFVVATTPKVARWWRARRAASQ